jgi:hypothetical protein
MPTFHCRMTIRTIVSVSVRMSGLNPSSGRPDLLHKVRTFRILGIHFMQNTPARVHSDRLACRAGSTPSVPTLGVGAPVLPLAEAFGERLEVAHAKPGETFDVHLRQPAGGDQAFDRPHRDAESFGRLVLGDQ